MTDFEIPVREMRAALLVEQRSPLVIDTIELPARLDVGQVFVKILYTGICGSQVGEQQGVKGEDKFLPHLLGHEATARVMAIGPGVSLVKPGQLVVIHWRPGAGLQGVTPKYEWRGKKVNAGWVTTFSEYSIISENRMTAVPEDIDHEAGSLLGCAVLTGLGAVTNNARVSLGESVVVIGAGGVGLNVIEGAALHSAYPIVAVDLYDKKLELAREFGATHFINASKTNVVEEIQKLLGRAGADVVFDNTGNTKMIEAAYEIAGAQGRIVLIGVPKKGSNISIYSLPLHFGKSLTGSHGGESNPTTDIPRCLKLIAAGKINLKRLVTDRGSLDDVNSMMQRMMRGEVTGRCVISVAGPSA